MTRRDNERMKLDERITRGLQYAGQRLAGERGSKVANVISTALGCGRIEFCDDPACPDCTPR